MTSETRMSLVVAGSKRQTVCILLCIHLHQYLFSNWWFLHDI